MTRKRPQDPHTSLTLCERERNVSLSHVVLGPMLFGAGPGTNARFVGRLDYMAAINDRVYDENITMYNVSIGAKQETNSYLNKIFI